MPTINLPNGDGRLHPYTTQPPRQFPEGEPPFSRVAYSAAHVVADPLADVNPWLDCAIDWDRTIAYRHYLWSLGLGVAESMDTAQRGMGLDWPTSLELIRRSLDAAPDGALIASGAGTDHIQPGPATTVDDVIQAYEEQIAAVEALGGRIIVMASRALAACARGPDDYLRVYDRILSQVAQPVILHWLGDMFDPALAGYWGSTDIPTAMDTCLQAIQAHPDKVDGIKISLLSKQHEIAMRRRLPKGVRMYTGDDFDYAELIAGDEQGHSDALLGIFDAIAPAASAALGSLRRNDLDTFHDVLAPTVPLSRHIFKAPTRFYKTGVVFMAFLNGHQDHFVMVGGQQSTRSLPHLAELFRLADQGRPAVGPGARRPPHGPGAGGAWGGVMAELARLSLNTITLRQWTLAQCIEGCARHGIPGISPWRDVLAAMGVQQAARRIRDAGLRVSGLCRGGMFTPTPFQEALDDNRRAIDEAHALGADCLVMVCGGLLPGSKDIVAARQRVEDGLAAILPHARAAGVTLALEPLHPMTCADRSVLSTTGQALALAERLGPGVGLALDVYHIWWDPDLAPSVSRAAGRIAAFHVCDWLVPTRDLVLDRGMMGDGAIDVPVIRAMMDAAGYRGMIEVEIMSERNWWTRDGNAVLEVMKQRFAAC